MDLPSPIAARSDNGSDSAPTTCARRFTGSTATILAVGVLSEAPRPPITKAVSPIDAAAACVVGAGSDATGVTVRMVGVYAYTTLLAVPFSREPPAITSRPPAAVTAA